MSGWLIYFITRMEYIQGMLGVMVCAGIASSLMALIFWVCSVDNGDKDIENLARHLFFKRILPALFISAILFCLIPGTKDMAAIYLIPKIVNNEQIQKIPDNTLNLLNSKLEAWIEDVIPSEPANKDSNQ